MSSSFGKRLGTVVFGSALVATSALPAQAEENTYEGLQGLKDHSCSENARACYTEVVSNVEQVSAQLAEFLNDENCLRRGTDCFNNTVSAIGLLGQAAQNINCHDGETGLTMVKCLGARSHLDYFTKEYGTLVTDATELAEAQGELEVANEELTEVQGELEVANEELTEVQGELEVANEKLAASEYELLLAQTFAAIGADIRKNNP